jgi:hypothetical protein
MIIQRLICKVKGHILVDAGACPFTGNTYVGCTRCNTLKVV